MYLPVLISPSESHPGNGSFPGALKIRPIPAKHPSRPSPELKREKIAGGCSAIPFFSVGASRTKLLNSIEFGPEPALGGE